MLAYITFASEKHGVTLSSLFSSPSKEAGAAASAEHSLSEADIASMEQYVKQQQDEVRGAIAGLPPSPYLEAGKALSPSAYAVDPNNTVSFGQGGLPPGLMQGKSMTAMPAGPPRTTGMGGEPRRPEPPMPTPTPITTQPGPIAPQPPHRPMPIRDPEALGQPPVLDQPGAYPPSDPWGRGVRLPQREMM